MGKCNVRLSRGRCEVNASAVAVQQPLSSTGYNRLHQPLGNEYDNERYDVALVRMAALQMCLSCICRALPEVSRRV